MTTLKERLEIAMAGPPKISQAAIARACGIKPPSVNDWLSGKTQTIEGSNLLAAAKLLNVSPEWLANGKGNQYRIKDANPSRYRIAESNGEDDAMPIQLLNASGSCGGGSIDWDDETREPLLKEPSWFRRYKIKPRDAIAVWADGDSMADFIVDGDIVIFDKSKTLPKSGRIYLIDHPDGLRIKRIRREIDGTWVIESNNPDKRKYPDEKIEPEHAELLSIKGEFIYRQGG